MGRGAKRIGLAGCIMTPREEIEEALFSTLEELDINEIPDYHFWQMCTNLLTTKETNNG